MKERTYKLHPFKGKNGRWYWHIRAPNGRLIVQCAEGDGYSRRSAAIRSARRMEIIAAEAVIA